MKKPLIVLNLKNFAYHVHQILSHPAPCEFSLSPLPGLKVPVRIENNKSHCSISPIWDSVYLNGNDHCGNRCGGIAAYSRIVQDYLHNLNAKIINENESDKEK